MLTRAQPVASAAASEASSRMPPDSSTATSSLERVAVAGLAARRALDQPYRLAAGHVHRGQQRQAHRSISSQLASSAEPASPDFSGWNWVAHSGPFSTAATNGSPWVAKETRGGVMYGDGGNERSRAA